MQEERRPAARLADRRSLGQRVRDWFRGRPRANEPEFKTPLRTPSETRIGICCSGGGVRSAAYNLGALQVLREEGTLDEAELVSAVSGGCYIAAAHAAVGSASPPGLLGKGTPPVYAPGSPEEQHLRNHSTYMAPGAGGKLRLLFRLVIGLGVNLALVALMLFLMGVPLGWAYAELYPQLESSAGAGWIDEIPWWIEVLTIGLFGGGVLLATPDLFKRIKSGHRRDRLETWSYRLAVAAFLVFASHVALPQLILLARSTGTLPLNVAEALPGLLSKDGPAGEAASLFAALTLGGVIIAVLGAIGAFISQRRLFFALAAAALAGPLVLLAALLLFANGSAVGGASSNELGVLAVALAVAAGVWLFADLTQWSLHPFYRRRLSSAFFVRRVGEPGDLRVEELDYREPLRLSDLRDGKHFPQLVVCAAANISDPGETPPGRAATPFTFSAADVGGPLVGAVATSTFEDQARLASRDLTLPAAVAMSGAALSPAMGKKTIRALTLLMALTNIRLGVWVPNPRHAPSAGSSRFPSLEPVTKGLKSVTEPVAAPFKRFDAARAERGRPTGGRRIWSRAFDALGRRRAAPHYLLREMLALTRLNDRFLYVTDGGHYDNLGLIELLRRGCTTIYCLDGGGDPGGTYRALGEAVALARGDLQVDIDVDPAAIVPDKKTRFSSADHVIGRFRYRVSPSGEPLVWTDAEANDADYIGRLIYCRAAVTEDAPWDVKAYHEKTRRFPYHSTSDQLFDDQRFEAYRSLGAHTARRAVESTRRQTLSDEVRGVLRVVAAQAEVISYEDLVARLRPRMAATRQRNLRQVIAEISAAEVERGRPPLGELVRGDGALTDEGREEVAWIWEYHGAQATGAVTMRSTGEVDEIVEPSGSVDGATRRRRVRWWTELRRGRL